MNLFLVCVSGEHKGQAWRISEEPLTLGRAPSSSIVLSSRSISRRHCQIVVRDETVLLEDLGCRNLPLVNGKPVRHHVLVIGDDVLLGQEHFELVSSKTIPVSQDKASDLLCQTVNWERIGVGTDGMPVPSIHPRTVQDLAVLYEAVCEFSGCADPHALMEIVQRRLIHYFNPEALWISRHQGVSRSSLFTTDARAGDGAAASISKAVEPRALMDACLQQNRALLERNGAGDGDQGEILCYAAPVIFDGIPLAIIALRTHAGRDVHPDGGLQFLALFAHSLAPALFGAEQNALLRRDNERLRIHANVSHTIVGESEAMQRLRKDTMQVARTAINVLITGETGVGKELAARAVHDFSPRREAPLVIVNCAAIPRELFESELFGHTKGAYTGATSAEPGLLAKANGGTLFLDEIGDLSLDNQARILRVVENRTFRAIGSTADVHVDVRIITATNKDLAQAVRQGKFREDLYHRVRGVEINVPPLREHLEDIPALAEHFLFGLREENQRVFRGFGPGVFDALRRRHWPGNVRELRHAVHRAMTFAQSDLIQVEDILELPAVISTPSQTEEELVSLETVEKQHIIRVLQQCNGNVRLAAQVLNISRTTLYNKINVYGIKI